ncbi:MAG: hypothetical protein HUU37_11545 [Bdellovibrionales bacterium]|nr:hypothetical protein [Bdellovibrionales bacterium]
MFPHTKELLLAAALLAAIPSHADGGINGGGGQGEAGHFASVVARTEQALKNACALATDANDRKACALLPRFSDKARELKVLPRMEGRILGSDGKSRDAGNDGSKTVFLDVTRWKNRTQSPDSKDKEKQLLLAIHETAVLAKLETNDSYNVSQAYLGLLDKLMFSAEKIVGSPAQKKGEALRGPGGKWSRHKAGIVHCSSGTGWRNLYSISLLPGNLIHDPTRIYQDRSGRAHAERINRCDAAVSQAKADGEDVFINIETGEVVPASGFFLRDKSSRHPAPLEDEPSGTSTSGQ